MTITNPEIVLPILANNGRDINDGPHAVFPMIYKYRGQTGEELFALFTDPAHDDMDSSPYVNNPVCLMSNCNLTEEGINFLAEVGEWHRSLNADS